ncbi:DUF3515 domain-containing protein [Streptomyces pactum]|uniref:DUF3515 domain-containing protein n=1 Tax=Streptomyces pactum TaxID=68249 RepID=A0ABS0NPH2_9ACTN|nr:DUF3515 domain-containing protein [Streptomyces pactum]MBH5337083.1 DUF3515 domain-containing protein [Streptomyces pactum]
MRSRRRLLAAGLAVPLLLVALYLAFGDALRPDGDGGVRVAVPESDRTTARICAELIDAVPSTVAGAERRETRPGSRLTAAWGDPAIVLRCGVPRPDEMNRATATGAKIGEVDWMLESPGEDGRHRCTTALRTVYVEVSIPGSYQDVTPLEDLAEAIRKTVPAGISDA